MDLLASKKTKLIKLVEFSFDYKTKQQIIACIGYGSSIIQQKGNKASMLDIIFIVKNTEIFHINNLSFNTNHYNLISKTFGSKFPTMLNDLKPYIYFNHSVMLKNDENKSINCKYGVISLNNIKKDNLIGDNLFTLGRLQKPFIYKFFSFDEETEILKLFDKNKKIAFTLGVICTDFSKKELYKNLNYDKEKVIYEILFNILNLSYIGDVRFYLKGEKRSKVQDMLDGGSLEIYFENYKNEFEEIFLMLENNHLNDTNSLNLLIKNYLNRLPLEYLSKIKLSNSFFKDNDSFIDFLSNNTFNTRINIINTYLKKINFNISLRAFVINTFTSKFSKGVYYLMKKLRKSIFT